MSTQQKVRLPKAPKNRFSFSVQKENPSSLKPKSASATRSIFFLFEEDLKGKALKKISASIPPKAPKATRKVLLREKRRKAFSAKNSQRLNLGEADVLLVGLGKQADFHPENFSSVVRGLGADFAKEEHAEIQIRFSDTFAKALRGYEKKYKDYFSKSSANIQKQASGARITNGKKPKAALLPSLDYASPYKFADALFALVCSLEIGAADLKLLSGTDKASTKKGKSGQRKKKKANTKPKKKSKVAILTPAKKAGFSSRLSEAKIVTGMLNRSRYLASLPGNYLNPENYERYVRKLCSELPLELQVFDPKRLSRLGCGGILSVGQGSSIPPRMLVIEYKPKRPKNKRPFVLIGKGVTFDSGGISLKPSAEMHEMKFDMCGSALALHSIALAARRGLPLHIVALIGLAENLPDGSAIKPGDVYTAYNGKTVEIQNTDAEGRLILADLLSYASDKYNPGILFEYSTLTGACIIALGHHVAGVMTPSDALYRSIERASRRSLDRTWRLPHWSVYGEALKSDIADLRNIGGRPAGTISAMRFLQSFVGENVPWAHFDIAGAAWSGKAQGSQPEGATGWGIRLMNQYFTEQI